MNPNEAVVLLADDEDTLRENLAQVLREEGFYVLTCRDGGEAFKTLRQRHVDAVITDLRMPGVTGMDLIGHAARLAPDAVTIVMTAFGDVETAVTAMRKGVCDYICKPLNLDEVVFKLKRLLAHDHLQRENAALRARLTRAVEAKKNVVESPMIDFDERDDSERPPLFAEPTEFDLRHAVHEFERQHITRALAYTEGNKTEAARVLGIGLSSLYRKLDELGMVRHITPDMVEH